MDLFRLTNSQLPAEPKSTENCTIFSLYQQFANQAEISELAKRYQQGIGWGEAKAILFEKMDKVLTPAREKYEALIAHPEIIDGYLKSGAEKARMSAVKLLKRIKTTIGI